MKLREVQRAVDNFQYEVIEVTIPKSGPVKKDLILLKTNQTNIRCLQFNMWHEKLVKDQWFIITPEEFTQELSRPRNPQVKVRKAKTNEITVTKIRSAPINENILSRLMITNHARLRMIERYNIKSNSDQKAFLIEKFKDHFIVQNYHLYRKGGYNDNLPNELLVCSRDFKAVFAVNIEAGLINIKTVYTPIDYVFTNFLDWFQDHMHIIHELPRLEDYLK